MKNSRAFSGKATNRARTELSRRIAARSGCLAFTQYTMPGYKVGPQHRLLCDKLDAVERGEIKRLMVFMPPRHGKSELTSKRFPAWFLGRNPTKQVITASYSADLAQDFGRHARNIVASSEFRALFPSVGVADDSAARDKWHTTKGGVYTAAGVSGSLTGKGAHIALIDDPIKGRQEAESATVRNAVWDWYRSVLRTRLMPGGAIVLVLTRWHPDDLAGRLLDEMDNGTGESWEVLSLPAIADRTDDALHREIGQPLWPDVFGLCELEAIRKSIGPREWSALYQQQPTPGEGTLFKTGMFPVLDAAPLGGTIVRRWDLAATRQVGTRDPDWTVGVKMARDTDGRFSILDVVRFRGAPQEVEAAIKNTAALDGPGVEIVLPQDPGQAGKAQAEYFIRMLSGYRVRAERETGDKATRAAPFSSQANAGNVSLVRAPWNRTFLDELGQFPAGAHDDQVDAAAGAFSALCGVSAPLILSRDDLSKI
ncbi:phage terminase large subunit [Acetobacter senegalensis]|uniref:phage terminase large subunit n=1 Tax=Acetobacter senegalensis TaxID=446692 RepID=UPI001EDDA974|nr:phage terminase large subunit [Acetobacter senegalensis]MCG4273908.1 phage terminase large subunit [Acetobacter senegalensis]